MSWFGSSEPVEHPESLAPEDWRHELPSPEHPDDFHRLAEELLAEVEKFALEEHDAWTEVSQDVPGVLMHEREGHEALEGTSLTLLRTSGKIKGLSPRDILQLNLELDVHKRKFTDPDLIKLQMIKEISEHVQVTISEVACPFPVSNREFVDVRVHRECQHSGRIVFGCRSVNVLAPRNPDLVTAKGFNGLILTHDPAYAGTHMTFVGYVDPKGWVPHAILNAARTTVTQKYDIYRKVALKRAAAAEEQQQ